MTVVISGSCRTAIGKFGGSLASASAVELGATVIAEAVRRSGVPSDLVDEVIMGNVLQAGLGQNPARQAALGAGLPNTVVATTVNVVCGSGMSALAAAASKIQTGEAGIVVAGGMESMSNAPYLLPKARWGLRSGDTPLIDSMHSDGLTDAFGLYPMGITAENVARAFRITREEQDQFALRSQQNAAVAQQNGLFKDEIVPVLVKDRKVGEVAVNLDEHIRASTTADTLGSLPPAFVDNGSVTVGNSSGINDGAAAMVLMSSDRARELGIHPEATWVSSGLAGVDPAVMGMGPVPSIKKATQRAHVSLDDIDVIELNEAFAAQSVAVIRDLGLNGDLVNPRGGAIALGHPIGASGARIVVTLIHEMRDLNATYGLASLCIGGGMGIAAVVAQ